MPSSLEEKFAEAYQAHSDEIFRHCYLRTGDREQAIDIMQETFMKTWEYLASGKKVKNLRAFLYKAANNLVIDQARRAKKRQVDSLEDMQEDGFDLESEEVNEAGKGFDEEQVVAVLGRLDEPYRTTIIMRYIDGLSPKEIAQALDESANVISVRVNRGIQKLRALLPKTS